MQWIERRYSDNVTVLMDVLPCRKRPFNHNTTTRAPNGQLFQDYPRPSVVELSDPMLQQLAR